MNDGDSAIGVCGNDSGCIFTAGNEASGVYGQPVWISVESKTKSAGRHQGIIRKKKIRDFAQGTGGSTEYPSNDGQGEPVFHHLCSCSGTVLRWGIHCYFVGEFFPGSGDGSGFFISTIWYVKLTANHYKRDVSAELETALSVITTAYLRTEDIVTAVEENIAYLNPPVSRVFQDFLIQIKMVNPDVQAALRILRGRIDNEVFREWCDAVSDCQHDRSLKTTLPPIVSKLSDMRNVNAELEYMIAEPRKEFMIMVVFVVGNIPLMYLLNQDWYDVLMHTVLGQCILAATAAAIFISAGFVVKLTRPIEYRR